MAHSTAPKLLAYTALLPTTGVAVAAQTPNFVIIMADDMGYGDIGCFGNPVIKTPNLDRMAAEGMLLTDYHSNGAVSTPTRAALLTGRYQQRAGLEGVLLANSDKHREGGLQPEEVTLAKVLSDNGYRTAMFGKWHLGYLPKYNPATVHGFGEFTGFLSGNVDYKTFLDSQGRYDWWQRDSVENVAGYLTDVINRSGADFIRRTAGQPFCLYLAHGCPHSPYQGPDDPPVRTRGSNKTGQVPGKTRERCYKEMIERLDLGVGQVMDALKEKGLERNTLVLFVSDNGPTGPGSAGQLRGAKGDLFEGGHRVPGIVRMPGTVPAGNRCDAPVVGMDFFPTMLSMAGIAYDTGAKPLDGVDVSPILRGEQAPARTLYWRNATAACVREGNMKYIEMRRGDKDAKYLFDLSADPNETKNIAGQNRPVVRHLQGLLAAWEKDVDAGTPEQTTQNR